MSRTTQVSKYQKGKTRKVKTNLDLLEQEIVSGSGICWAICKSAPYPRQLHQQPTTQFFTGRMPFLPPNQQRQSIENMHKLTYIALVHLFRVESFGPSYNQKLLIDIKHRLSTSLLSIKQTELYVQCTSYDAYCMKVHS